MMSGKFFWMAVFTGIVLRLLWISDMSFQGDEFYNFTESRKAGQSQPFWPDRGLISSTGIQHPGMGVGIFSVIGKIAAARTPLELAYAVIVLNCLALVFFGLIVNRWIPIFERPLWSWAVALYAVSPYAVFYERKIWAPSIIMIFTTLMILGFLRREKHWGSFLLAIGGMCCGQLHMGGFFLFAIFSFVAVRKMRLLSFGAGVLIGVLPMISWIRYYLNTIHIQHQRSGFWGHLRSFTTQWIIQPLGLDLQYQLGSDYPGFLSFPRLGGIPLYLMMILLGVIIGIALYILMRRLIRCAGELRFRWNPVSWTFVLMGGAGLGLVMAINHVHIYPQYLLITYPLPWVFQALVLYSERLKTGALLKVFWIAQLLLTIGLLCFLHFNGGANGDYGTSYRNGKYYELEK